MNPTLVQQAILIVVSLGLAVAVRRGAQTGRLSFGTAAMWTGLAALGLVASALIPSVGRIGSILGLLPAAVFAGAASALLAGIAFSLSTRVSELESDRRDLAEVMGCSTVHPAVPAATSGDDMLAIVPAFNESRSVADVVTSLRSIGLPVLVIDDGSTDATADVARSAGASVLRLPINLGVGGALRAGLRTAVQHGYQQVVQCDADGQHPIGSIQTLIEEQREAPEDLLIGSRFTAGFSEVQGFARTAAIRLLATIASRASGARISDSTSGLRIIQQPLLGELADKLERHYLGDTFEVVVAAGKAGYTIVEMPIQMVERSYGTSTASAATAARMTLRALLTASLRFYRPFAPAASRTRCG
jgi:hypothetical protein